MNEKLCRTLVKDRAVAHDPALHSDSPFLPCEGCGEWHDGLEMHHRKFRSRGGLWLPSNILALCTWCHQSATDERPLAVASGWNVASGALPSAVPVSVWYAERSVLLDDQGGWRIWDQSTPPF